MNAPRGANHAASAGREAPLIFTLLETQRFAERIRHEQSTGLIDPSLDADWIARALNLMDVELLIGGFGKEPQDPIEDVVQTIVTVWRRTLYCSDSPSDPVGD